MEKEKIVLIKVSESTRDTLKTKGIKGETYDIIIKRLMKDARKAKQKVAKEGAIGYV